MSTGDIPDNGQFSAAINARSARLFSSCCAGNCTKRDAYLSLAFKRIYDFTLPYRALLNGSDTISREINGTDESFAVPEIFKRAVSGGPLWATNQFLENELNSWTVWWKMFFERLARVFMDF